MAIVNRDGNLYVYESFRRNGKVTSRYVGTGLIAEYYEIVDPHEKLKARHEKNVKEAIEANQLRRLKRREKRVIAAADTVEGILASLLIASGFRQTKRGPWRKKRETHE